MSYSPTEVIKQFVKSDGTKCTKIDDIFAYLDAKTYRAPLVINGNDLSNGSRVIDVIAIGIDQNWLRSGEWDPVVMSLDFKGFMDLNLKSDTTFADANTGYFSFSKPMYENYLNGGITMGSTLIKTQDLVKLNSYIRSDRKNPWCSGRANADVASLIIPKNNKYWSENEKNISNYSRNAAAMDKVGVMTLTKLLYTTELIDQLQTRFGYRMGNQLDAYHWSNWIGASATAAPNGGMYCAYYKLMFLTEFDFYMHAGVMTGLTPLNTQLCKSAEFANMIAQIVDPSQTTQKISDTLQYYGSNTLKKDQILPAGQFIYSKDYQYKMHVTHNGNVRVYKLPILDDDITKCHNQCLAPSVPLVVNADNLLTTYLLLAIDGKIALGVNPGTSMQRDANYWNMVKTVGTDQHDNNTVLVIVGNFCAANKLPFNNGWDKAFLRRVLINKNPLNAAMLILGKTSYIKSSEISGYTARASFHGGGCGGTDTGGNVYYNMSDYQLIVNSGGALTAVNAGMSSKLAVDEVAFITKSNSNNWSTPTDTSNTQCIRGWKYINPDGSDVSKDFSKELSIHGTTNLGDTKNWCYQNPFLVYTGSDGTKYKFGATQLQQILWYVGTYSNNIDSIYTFLRSGFIQKAADAGYVGGISINSDSGRLITVNYCMQGNRWITDGACKATLLQNNYSPTLKSLIDFDIKKRICDAPTGASQILCAVVKPTGLNDVESSLVALSSDFAYSTTKASVSAIAPVNKQLSTIAFQSGTYGIKSDIDRLDIVKRAISANSNKLSEAQLLYLRRFYSLTTPIENALIYGTDNLFVYGNDYVAGQRAFGYSPKMEYLLTFQSDGNLVAQRIDSATTRVSTWYTSVAPSPSAVLSIELNGNVSIYSDSTKAISLWSTNTRSKNPIALTVDPYGIVVLLEMTSPNNVWVPIWTSNGLTNYVRNTFVVMSSVEQMNFAEWQAIYRTNMKLQPLAARIDIPGFTPATTAAGIRSFAPFFQDHKQIIGLPYGVIAYKDSYGTIVYNTINFDPNTIKEFGTNLSSGGITFSPNDIVWKYFLGYLNISFPAQIAPIGASEFANALSVSSAAMLIGSTSPYEMQTWNMSDQSGSNTVGNVLVWRLTSMPAVIAYRRSSGSTLDTDSVFKTACTSSVGSCYPEYSAILSKPKISLASTEYNTLCDIASIKSAVDSMKKDSSYSTIVKAYTSAGFGPNRPIAINIIAKHMAANNITGPSLQSLTDGQLHAILIGSTTASGILNGYLGTFSDSDASSLQTLCATAYGSQVCTDPSQRYKDRFGGRIRVRPTASKFTSRVESFSGASCVEVCNDPSAPAPVQNACKLGSIAYCSQSDNIYGTTCSDDMFKYPELSVVKSTWCDNNATHPNFSTHCKVPAKDVPASQSAGQAVGDPTNPATQSTTTNQDESAGEMHWWKIMLIILGALFGILIAGMLSRMVVKKFKSNVAPAPISLASFNNNSTRNLFPQDDNLVRPYTARDSADSINSTYESTNARPTSSVVSVYPYPMMRDSSLSAMSSTGASTQNTSIGSSSSVSNLYPVVSP